VASSGTRNQRPQPAVPSESADFAARFELEPSAGDSATCGGRDKRTGLPVRVRRAGSTRSDNGISLAHELAFCSRVDHPGVPKVLYAAAGPRGVTGVFSSPAAEALERIFAKSGTRPILPPLARAGETLDRIFAKSGTRSSELDVLRYGLEMADIAAAAHAAHFLLLEIGPANFAPDPQTKRLSLLQATVCLPLESTAARERLRDVYVGGVWGYMAPEQVTDVAELGPHTDVFAIGATLFRLLTGRAIYETDSTKEAISQTRNAKVPELVKLRKSINPKLAKLVHHCLAKAHEHRPATAYQVAADIHSLLNELGPKLAGEPRFHKPVTVPQGFPQEASLAERLRGHVDETMAFIQAAIDGRGPADTSAQEKARLERERLEKESAEAARQERQRLEQIQREQEAKVKAERERLEKERAQAERERLEKERAEAARQERQRLEQIQREQEAKVKAERERLEKERAEAARRERERLAQIQREQEAKVKAERERLEKERAEAARQEHERLEQIQREQEARAQTERERLEKEHAEAARREHERLAQIQREQEARAQAERERLEKERAEAARQERERLAQIRREQEARAQAERERLEKERAEAARQERERLAQIQREQEARAQAERERLEKERAEAARQERERLAQSQHEQEAKAQAERERLEKERAEAARQERERLAQIQREQEARAAAERKEKERVRQESARRAKEELEKAGRENMTLTPKQREPAGGEVMAIQPSAPQVPVQKSEVPEPKAVSAGEALPRLQAVSADRYQIRREIGLGGQGVCKIAFDQLAEREVILKISGPQGGWSAERLIKEARCAAKFNHPNVSRLLELGAFGKDQVFMTMPCIDGSSLDQVLKRISEAGIPGLTGYSIVAVAELFEKICAGVEHAHAAGILHLDLKPQNVLVGSQGEVVVLDWGLSQPLNAAEIPKRFASNEQAGAPGLTTTLTGVLAGDPNMRAVGTPAYLAPEQWAGDPGTFTERTDIYGLGGILFFLLTGGAPNQVQRPSDLEPYFRHSPAPLPSEFTRRRVPPELESLCVKCLARDPAQRYASVFHVRHVLKSWLSRPEMWGLYGASY